MGEPALRRPAGIIGLGLLGQALAGRLLGGGYPVCGYDTDEAARAAAGAAGVDVLAGPHAVAAACDVIFLSLPSSVERQDLLWGDGRLAGALSEGALLLDTTTGRPEDTEADAERLAPLHVDLVDACVLGSSEQVAAGDAVLLVGDRESRAGGYAPLLETFARNTFYLVDAGDGCRMKLVANQVLGLHRLVLAEALGLAERCGLDPARALEILKAGPASSAVMETKGRRMLDRDFAPAARLAQHAKDVDLILELGEACGATLPVSELHRAVLARLIEDGRGGDDNSVVIEAFSKTQSRPM